MTNPSNQGTAGGTPSVSGMSTPAGSSPQLRQVMQSVLNSQSGQTAGNIAMRSVSTTSGLTGQTAQPLISELIKSLKDQSKLLDGMRSHGANPNHIGSEENKLRNIEAALLALQNQQKTAMGRAPTFDPNFINNLNKIAAALNNPAVQKTLGTLSSPSNPPSTQPTPQPNTQQPSLASQLQSLFGGRGPQPGAGGAGNNTPPGTPPTPGAPPPPPPGGNNRGPQPTNQDFARIMSDIKLANTKIERFLAEKAGNLQTTLSKDDLKQVQRALSMELQNALTGGTLSQDEQNVALSKFNSTMSRFESSYREQSEAVKRLTSFISGAVTTLQLGNLTQRMFLSEPFQYQTMPAISAIGSTGKMGEVASAGIAAREQWELEQNQMGFGVGAGMMAGGAMLKGRAGVALGGLGAIVAGGSLMGGGASMRNIMSELGMGTGSEEIRNNITAKELMKPQTLAERGELSKSLFTAFGGNPYSGENKGAGSDFTSMGNYINGSARKSTTGNIFVDKFLQMGMGNGKNATDLGMNADQSGAFLANIAGNLNNKSNNQSMFLANQALKLGTAYGVDPNSFAQTYQGMQSVGMSNLNKNYTESLGVFADAKGEVSQFGANVLQPALMKVTQSLAMRSVSTSADKLSENVNSFQKYLMSGKDELSKRAANDPNIMGSMMGGFAASTQRFTESTGGAFYAEKVLGMNPFELQRGKNDPKVFTTALQNAIKNSGLNMGMFEKGEDGESWKIKNQWAGAIMPIAQNLGQDWVQIEQLIARYLESGGKSMLSKENEASIRTTGKVVDAKAGEKAANVANDPTTESAKAIALSANEFTKNVLSIQTEIKKLQDKTLAYVQSTEFINGAREGINRILAEAEKLLGKTSPGVNTESNTPLPIPENAKKDYFSGLINPVNSLTLEGKSPSDLIRLSKIVESGNSSDSIKSELKLIVDRLNKQAIKEGNSDFKQLINPNSIVDSARNIYSQIKNSGIILSPNDAPIRPPSEVINRRDTSVKINTMIQGNDWNKYFNPKDIKSNMGGQSVLSTFELDNTTHQKIKGAASTLDKSESNWMLSNLKISPTSKDFDEDSVLKRIWDKTLAKYNQNKDDKGLQAGLAAITSVRGMANSSKKEDITKILAMSASNSNGVLSMLSTNKDVNNNNYYSATGELIGVGGRELGPKGNTPKPKTPAKPDKSKPGQPTSSVRTETTGANETRIIITGRQAEAQILTQVRKDLTNYYSVRNG